ncbi:MAG: oligosaccharide flippase family protein [Phycisphaerae bacterium]|nr:oligosaccharide flippase family protein [Phycisphaerae bacterium]
MTTSTLKKRLLLKPSLKLNAFSNLLAIGVNIAIGFFLLPIIFSHLGATGFGAWMLVSSLIGYFGLLRLGVGTGVLRYVPMYRGQKDNGKIEEVIGAAMAFYIVVGAVIFLVSYFFAGTIADFFKGGSEFQSLVKFVGLAAAIECPTLIYDTAIRGFERYVLANTLVILGSVIRAAGLIICMKLSYGLAAMGATLAIVATLYLIIEAVAFRFYCAGVRVIVTKADMAVLKMLLAYGFIAMIESGAALLSFESPKMIVGKVMSLDTVGFFSMAIMLVAYYKRFVFSVTQVFMPRFSFLSGRKDGNSIRSLFLISSRYVTIIAGTLALLMWVVGPAFLRLWFHTDAVSQVSGVLAVLTGGMLVFVSHRISIDLLYGLGFVKRIAAFALLEGALVLLFSIFLAYRYGMTGVAIGVAIPLILVRGVVQTFYVCRLMEIGFFSYYLKCFLRPWLIVALLAVGGYIIGIEGSIGSWLSLFGVSFLALAAYGLLTWFVVLTADEKQKLKTRAAESLLSIKTLFLAAEKA